MRHDIALAELLKIRVDAIDVSITVILLKKPLTSVDTVVYFGKKYPIRGAMWVP